MRWFSPFGKFTRIGHIPGEGWPLLREGGPMSYEARPSRCSIPLRPLHTAPYIYQPFIDRLIYHQFIIHQPRLRAAGQQPCSMPSSINLLSPAFINHSSAVGQPPFIEHICHPPSRISAGHPTRSLSLSHTLFSRSLSLYQSITPTDVSSPPRESERGRRG